VIRKYAENAMRHYHLRPLTAEKENAGTAINLDSKRNPRIDASYPYLNPKKSYTSLADHTNMLF